MRFKLQDYFIAVVCAVAVVFGALATAEKAAGQFPANVWCTGVNMGITYPGVLVLGRETHVSDIIIQGTGFQICRGNFFYHRLTVCIQKYNRPFFRWENIWCSSRTGGPGTPLLIRDIYGRCYHSADRTEHKVFRTVLRGDIFHPMRRGPILVNRVEFSDPVRLPCT